MDRVRFRVKDEQYTWDNTNQRLYVGKGKVHQIRCERADSLFDLLSFHIDGQGIELPPAFQSETSFKDIRLQLQSLVVHESARELWLYTVKKTCWSCDDLAFLAVTLDQVIRSSNNTQFLKSLFGKLVGQYLLVVAQSALSARLFAQSFQVIVEGAKVGGSTAEVDELAQLFETLRLNEGPVTTAFITSLISSLQRLAENVDSERVSLVAESIGRHGLLLLRDGLQYPQTILWISLIGMTLANLRGLLQFRGALGYLFEDSRIGPDGSSDHLLLNGTHFRDLLGFQPTSDTERISGGAYLHVLNMFPPIPFTTPFFQFYSEDSYWQSSDDLSGIQRVFASWIGNPSSSLYIRLDYLGAHVGMALIFMFLVNDFLTPFNRPLMSQRGRYVTSFAFLLLVILKIVSVPFRWVSGH